MKTNIIILVFIGIIVIVALTVLGVKIFGSKDDGTCGNGQCGNPPTNDKIVIETPKTNEIISSPLEIKGKARGNWYFEASFPIRLLDENGQEIALTIAQAKGDWMTEDFVPFKAILEFVSPASTKGTLVFEKDNPSGLPEYDDQVVIPIRFQEAETLTVKAYFNNDKMDPEFSCNKVFPVERRIVKTQAVARGALEELLKGTTSAEEAKGFFTSINSGVKIQKLNIENGVAKVEFDEQLEFQVGGSCRVSAIRAQINQTLKQFSSVKEVIISVNGRTEDVLQP